jgi:hypothetical protein
MVVENISESIGSHSRLLARITSSFSIAPLLYLSLQIPTMTSSDAANLPNGIDPRARW